MKPAAAIVSMVLTAVVLGACDTNDGRDLRPPNPGATTTTTTPGGSAATGPGGSQLPAPADSVAGRFEVVLPFVGGQIERRYTCAGRDLAPQISWLGVPEGTVELAVVVRDLDADGFVHWVAAGIDPLATSLLPESGAAVVEAVNDLGEIGWSGPCPPEGDGAHRYEFTLYAVGRQLELAPESPAADAIEAIEGGATARAAAIGEFER